jgi:hypothetical protein
MKTLTRDLVESALDYAVLIAEGYTKSGCSVIWTPGLDGIVLRQSMRVAVWSTAGPIIERERLQIRSSHEDWIALTYKQDKWSYGSTPITAAMRCFVLSRLGKSVDVPEELL